MDLLNLKGLADSIMGGLDKLFTSDDERNQAKALIEAQVQQAEAALQGELSKRHAADMASDNKLSKNIRPAMLIASFALLAGVVICRLAGVEVPAEVTYTTGTLAGLAFSFYFGGRSGEKLARLGGLGRR